MATQSFDEMMEIDTPEKARNLELAYEDAKNQKKTVFESTILEDLRKSKENLKRESLL